MASAARRLASSHAQTISFQLDRAGRCFNHGGARPEPEQFIDVGFEGSAEAPDFGPEPRVGNQAEGLRIVRGDARKACFDSPHPETIQGFRNFEFLPRC